MVGMEVIKSKPGRRKSTDAPVKAQPSAKKAKVEPSAGAGGSSKQQQLPSSPLRRSLSLEEESVQVRGRGCGCYINTIAK
jgi:hypothetical protein